MLNVVGFMRNTNLYILDRFILPVKNKVLFGRYYNIANRFLNKAYTCILKKNDFHVETSSCSAYT